MPGYDPDDAAFQADPYAVYSMLRRSAPVQAGRLGIWLVSRFDDVQGALRDQRLTSDPLAWDLYPEVAEAIYGSEDSPVLSMQRAWMMLRDGEDHRLPRRTLAGVVSQSRVECALRHAQGVLIQAAQRLRERGGGDVMELLARRVPLAFVCHLMNIDSDSGAECQQWFDEFLLTFGPRTVSSSTLARAERAAEKLDDYFGGLVSERRRSPGEDVVSALVANWPAGRPEEALRANVALLFGAGHETTVNLIGNGLWLLLRERDWWRRLARQPADSGLVVEEVLRLESPVQLVSRNAVTDVAVGGQLVRAGQQVALLLGSANRDESRFLRAAAFDPERADAGAVAFGAGPHHCLGAHIARAEARDVFATLAALLPSLEAEADIAWRPTSSHRGPQQLLVTCAD
jgi:cytochrome P450